MKARLWILGVALTMFVASLAHSQSCNNHNATATITDTDGTVWANGSYTVAYYNPSGTQPPVCRSTGVFITTNYSGTLNASGQLTQSLPDTSSVDPNGQWIFTVQPLASVGPTVMRPVTLTANTSFSSTFSAQAIPPRVACTNTCYAYNTTTEVSSALIGSVLTNTTPSASPVCNLRTFAGFVACNTGAATGLTLTTTGVSGLATLIGNTLNVPNYSVTFSKDVTGSLTQQTVVGIEGNILPVLPSSGQRKFPAYDNIAGWQYYFANLTDTDPPSAGTCTSANVGQEVWASGSLPNVGVTKYTCTLITGPSRIWIAQNAAQWGYVTPTNQPLTNAGFACVSTGVTNQCTWQSIAGSSPTVTGHAFVVEQSGSSVTTVSSPVAVTAGQTALISFRNNGNAPTVLTFTDSLGNTCTTRVTSNNLGSDNITLGECVIVNAGNDTFTSTSNTAVSFRSLNVFIVSGISTFAGSGNSSGTGGLGNMSAFSTSARSVAFFCNGNGAYPSNIPWIANTVTPTWTWNNAGNNPASGSANQQCALFILSNAAGTSLYANGLPFYWSTNDGMAATAYNY